MRSTKGIGQRNNGVKGCLGLGTRSDLVIGAILLPLVAEVDVRDSVVMVSVYSSIAQKWKRVLVCMPW
jgi:hypothetical protein